LPIGGSEPFLFELFQGLKMLQALSRSCCRSLITVITLSCVLSGCGQSDQIEAVRQPASMGVEEQVTITIELGTWESVLQIVEQNRGKVVVVDLWSTSCVPCIKELPRLAGLQEARSDDVVCISFNVDYVGIVSKPPEYYLDRVEEVLQKCKANYSNVLCTTEADVLFQDLDLPSIPAVFVFDRNGSLAQRFDASLLDEEADEDEAFTYEHDVEPLVRRLIESDS
jgi:thiol-disulfide isomerase/thioredoxin